MKITREREREIEMRCGRAGSFNEEKERRLEIKKMFKKYIVLRKNKERWLRSEERNL